ncbi:MAG: hypothetical protein HXY41_07355 [Chloroflexi bacterium]|nr:hypothetical protein [Chloroflexota bacterium]
MTVPFSYYDFIEACGQPGCPVCALLQRDARRFLDSLLYEYVNKPATHAAFRASRALCKTHNSQLSQFGEQVLGIAILQAAALDEVLNIIAANPAQTPSGFSRWLSGGGKNGPAALADRLEPEQPCMVCRTLDEAEKRYLLTINDYLTDAPFEEAFRASAGLCLPHFRGALRQMTGPVALERLVAIQVDIWQKLKGELDSFITQHDYRYAGQPMGAERDSWKRAIISLAGK